MPKPPPPPPSKRPPAGKPAGGKPQPKQPATKTGPMGLVGKADQPPAPAPPKTPAGDAAPADAAGPAPALLDFLDRQAEAVTTGSHATGEKASGTGATKRPEETVPQVVAGPPASGQPEQALPADDDGELRAIPGVTDRRPAWHWAVIASPLVIVLLVLLAWPSDDGSEPTEGPADETAPAEAQPQEGPPTTASEPAPGAGGSDSRTAGSGAAGRGASPSATPEGEARGASPSATPEGEARGASPSATPEAEARGASPSATPEAGAASPGAETRGASANPSASRGASPSGGQRGPATSTSSAQRTPAGARAPEEDSRTPVAGAPRVATSRQPMTATKAAGPADGSSGMLAVACNRRCSVRLDGAMSSAAAGAGARVRAGRHVAIVTDAQTGYSITLRVDVPAGMLVRKQLTF